MKKKFIIHGYAPGCSGCIESEAGRSARGHSPICRERFENILKDDPIKIEADERAKCFQEETPSEPAQKPSADERAKCFQEETPSEPAQKPSINLDKLVKTIRASASKATNTEKKNVQVDVNINIVDKRIPGKWLFHGTRTDRSSLS